MLYRRRLQLQIIAAFAPRLLSGASSIVVSGRVHYNNPGHGRLWVGPHQSRKESGELKHNIIKKQERGIKNIYIFTLLNSSLVLFFGRLSPGKIKARHTLSSRQDVRALVWNKSCLAKLKWKGSGWTLGQHLVGLWPAEADGPSQACKEGSRGLLATWFSPQTVF